MSSANSDGAWVAEREMGVAPEVIGLPIEEIVRHHARTVPGYPAITFEDGEISYRAFDALTNRIAASLAQAGIGEDDRVAVALKNCPDSYLTLVAARKIGAVQVAINWRYSAEEIAWIVNNCRSKILVLDPDLSGMADEIIAAVGRPLQIFAAGEEGGGLPTLRGPAQVEPAADTGRISGPDEVAIQLYTSGTSGWPKGALITNANLTSFFRNADLAMPLSRYGAQLVVLPLFHVAALVGSLRTFAMGGHCVGQRAFDQDALKTLIPRHKVRSFVMVNTVLAMLVETADASTDFSSLEGVIVGGGALSLNSSRQTIDLLGCPLYSMYGSTELTFGVTVLRIDHQLLESPELLQSCGLPMEDVEIGIFDAETMEPLGEGVPGELWVRGGQRSRGYWENPEGTAEVYLADGWFRTGDIAAIEGGYLYIRDRLKDMVRSGGENVYPAEVERHLTEHPDVVEAIVFGIPDKKWGEAVHALVIKRQGAELTNAELIEFIRARLAHFKCPRAVEFVEDVERTPSGKPKKNVIRARYWEGKGRAIG